jgi:excisionase family DNA binding protein
MDTTTHTIYREYLEQTHGNEAAAAALTLADAMQRTLDAPKTESASPITVTPGRPLTVPEVAKFLQVAPTKIRAWIRSGRLQGYNVAETESGRPKYRVSPDDLEAFTKRRAPVQPAAVGRPSGRSLPAAREWPVLDKAKIARAKAERAKRE